MSCYSDSSFLPGAKLDVLVHNAKHLGTIQSVTLSWTSAWSLNPSDWVRRKVLHVQNVVQLENEDHGKTLFLSAGNQIEESKDWIASIMP